MEINELFELLDIECGDDFQYFENFSDLVEYDGAVESDVLFQLLKEINMHIFAELCESYFFEVGENIPDVQVDVYTLLDNIKRALIGLSEAVSKDGDSVLIKLADELNKFRIWYSVDLNVECKNRATGKIKFESVRDAIVLARLEKFDGEEHAFDFTEALDYELDEYIMTYADMASVE